MTFGRVVLLIYLAGAFTSSAQDNAYLQRRNQLLEERSQLNQTVWAQESEAQRHENTLVQLWDALLDISRKKSGDKFAVFKGLGLEEVWLGAIDKERSLDHGITK